jgi:hypothetical protein
VGLHPRCLDARAYGADLLFGGVRIHYDQHEVSLGKFG